MSGAITVMLWNVLWRRPDSSAGTAIRDIISAHDPDLVCLTESHHDLLSGGHIITSHGDYGYGLGPKRRKVVMWSRHPWMETDDSGDPALPTGRFVGGVTATPLGPLSVFGVCIPWQNAHVSGGRRDRLPWQEHGLYLDGLQRIIARPTSLHRTLLLGDFNQTIPRSRAPQALHDKLVALMSPHLRVATGGTISGLAHRAIDHLAHSHDLEAVSVTPLPDRDGEGRRLSDHVGLVIRLRPA